MPIFSRSSRRNRESQSASLRFYGPDNEGCVKAIDCHNREAACFCIAGDSIFRTLPTQQLICTIKRRSFSGRTMLDIHGSTVEIKQSWEGMQYGKDIMTASGTLRWRPGSAGFEELRDGQKNLIARGKLPGLLAKRPPLLEVFSFGDESLLDLIFASWITMLRD